MSWLSKAVGSIKHDIGATVATVADDTLHDLGDKKANLGVKGGNNIENLNGSVNIGLTNQMDKLAASIGSGIAAAANSVSGGAAGEAGGALMFLPDGKPNPAYKTPYNQPVPKGAGCVVLFWAVVVPLATVVSAGACCVIYLIMR